MRAIRIFDTTLRDGEQSPGCSMNKEEKLEVARQLEKLGVDIIEAGFAVSSKGDFESIEQIAKTVKHSTVCSLARAMRKDIEAAGNAIRHAKSGRIHTFIATSPIHLQYKLKMTEDQVVEAAVDAVKFAKTFVSDVEFSCEDAGRSDRRFLVRVINEAVKAGATTINIPDTVGYLIPHEYGELIRFLMDTVPGIENVAVSVHCHDDLGLATANSLAGVLNGATQIECTVNGIGERAGNTALEEVVMALDVRKEIFKCQTRINTREIMKTSRLITNITGFSVQPNKAIVGANAFAHEAGIHQDGMLKQRTTYEIIDPAQIGLTETKLVLGKHSGRHAFVDRLKELGFDLSKEEIEKAFEQFKILADKKKTVSDRDIESMVSDEVHNIPETYTFHYVQIIAGNTTRPVACVQIMKNDQLLESVQAGEGPVDAIYRTVEHIVGEKIELVDFTVHSVTGGTDALGEVTIKIRDGNEQFVGRGASLDVLVAATKALISAINKMIHFRQENRGRTNAKTWKP